MAQWDFKHKTVQQYDNPESSGQLGSKAVLISFGPPVYSASAKFLVCGFVQNLNMNQQKQIQELFEIGSERRYFVEGVTRNNLSVSRALFSGPSLLKLIGGGILNQSLQSSDLSGINSDIFEGESRNAAAADFDKNFWINLGSDLFRNPLGILLQFKEFYGNGKSQTYGAVYLGNAKINAHSLAMQSQMWLMQESIQVIFENTIPLSKGSDTQESYEKRFEIMQGTNQMTPSWFENYKNWDGTYSGNS